MQNPIAERILIAEEVSTGLRRGIHIRIGTPYWNEGEEFASCPVEYAGLFEKFADAKGVDTLQALQIATNIDSMLRRLKHKYKFFWATGESYFDGSRQ